VTDAGNANQADLAERLREAFNRVGALEVSAERRTALVQRLIAITNAAKHDETRAQRRLDAFLAELERASAEG
jgi:hypothetical protein